MSCLQTTERVVGPLFVRPSGVLAKGDVIEGHTHRFDHTTILFSGAVSVVEDGVTTEYRAPAEWSTPKDALHEITALEDGTVFYCVYPHREPDGTVVEAYKGNVGAYH